jgi:hypothetical protein
LKKIKNKKYENEKDTSFGEFPKGEELEKDELPKTIKILPALRSIIFFNILEYYYIKK